MVECLLVDQEYTTITIGLFKIGLHQWNVTAEDPQENYKTQKKE